MDCLPFLNAGRLSGAESTSAGNVRICQKASSSCAYPRQTGDRWFLPESSVHSNADEHYVLTWTDMTGEWNTLTHPLPSETQSWSPEAVWSLGSGARLLGCGSHFSFFPGPWYQLLKFSKADLPNYDPIDCKVNICKVLRIPDLLLCHTLASNPSCDFSGPLE